MPVHKRSLVCELVARLTVHAHSKYLLACADPERFDREGPNLTYFCFVLFFLVDNGRDDRNAIISGKWRFAGV